MTALNASNISSGTVPTARLGSGTASSSTFLAGDSTFKTVTGTTINNNADNRVITGSDSANTLEGETNLTYDGSTLKINGGLVEIAHTSCHLDFMETSTTNHRLRNGSGNFQIQKISDDKNTTTTQFLVDGGTGAVELYHNGSKKFETASYGTHVTGYQTSSSYVGFHVKGTLSDNGFGTNHGSGITNFDVDYYSPIPMFSSKTIDYGSSYLSFPSYASGNYVKFTAPVAGLYQLELIASVETHHGGDWFAFGWEINTTTIDSSSELANNGRGTLSVYDRTSVDAGAGSHFSTTIYMEANDYAILYQQSASAVRFASNQYFVRGHLIH